MEWPSPAFYPCLAHTWSLTSSRYTNEGRLGSLSTAKCGQRPRPVGSPPEPGLSGALARAGAQGGVWKRPGQCGLKQWPHPGSNPHRLLDLGPGPASPAAKIQPGAQGQRSSSTQVPAFTHCRPAAVAGMAPAPLRACLAFHGCSSSAQEAGGAGGGEAGRETDNACPLTVVVTCRA